MYFLKRIFNLANAVLFAAILSIIVGIFYVRNVDGNFDHLIAHNGIIEDKWFTQKSFTKTTGTRNFREVIKYYIPIFNFRVAGNKTSYSASRFPKALDNLLQQGDSITFYTKKVTSKFGNILFDGKQHAWNSDSPDEVFHLVSNKYDTPLIDFHQ